MTYPSFIIAGAQKAGTTSLYAMVSQHPRVFMSQTKEPGYFIRGFNDPEDWQTLRKPDIHGRLHDLSAVKRGVFTDEDYQALFSSTEAHQALQRGEASTPYLPSPYAARRIAETIPEAKIIIALRDPVERAYSAWGYNYSRGNENAATFDEAVRQELEGGRENWIWGSRYLYAGLYSRHLQRYQDHFPEGQLLVLKFEDFREDPSTTFARMCEFLDIPVVKITEGERENPTVRHDNPFLARVRSTMTTHNSIKAVAKAFLPARVRGTLRNRATKVIDRFGGKPEKLSYETRLTLADYFADDCARLSSMVDFSISDWTPMQPLAERAAQ